MRVIITGSTGMIGKGVLLECLDDESIEQVLVVNRNPLTIEHAKLKEVILNDFANPSLIRDSLKGYDATYFCLGVSSSGMEEKDYHHITYDYTINFAQTFLEVNPGSTFIFVSGQGTDSSEKGRLMWARVKGKTENKILAMKFRQAYMFRPGIIRPLRGIKSKTNWYSLFYKIIKPFWPVLLAIFGNAITDTIKIGRAMINVTIHGSDQIHFENRDINQLVE